MTHNIRMIIKTNKSHHPRLALPVAGRIPRVVPEYGAEFDGFTVPAGVCQRNISLNHLHASRNLQVTLPDKSEHEYVAHAP